MLKEFNSAKDDDICYIEYKHNDDFFRISELLLSKGYKNIIFSKYDSITDILKNNDISNYQIISKKRNLKNIAFVNLAKIYEKDYNYIIVNDKTNYPRSENIADSDILTLVKLNNLKKTLKMLQVIENDQNLNSFEKLIFNTYSTIGVALKKGVEFSLSFNSSLPFFKRLEKKYKKTSSFKFVEDHAYYDKYSIPSTNQPFKLCSERYHQKYWNESISQISKIIRAELDPIDEDYLVLELLDINPYFYHQFLLNSPKTVYFLNSVPFQPNLVNDLKRIYPNKNFIEIESDFKGFHLSIFANSILANSLNLLAGAIIAKCSVFVYNSCSSLIKLNKWINYENVGEFSVTCVGLETDFIQHYLSIGFTKIIFWNNSNQKIPKDPRVIEFKIDQVSNLRKFQLYNQSIKICKKNDLLLVIDDDEFLDVQDVSSIEKFETVLLFKWKVYGAGSEIFHNNDLNKCNFSEVSEITKSMIKVRDGIVFNSNHFPDCENFTYSRFFIKHYISKSLEDYLFKCRRRIDFLGDLRYNEQAYQNFIKVNPQFIVKIQEKQFNEVLHSENIHDSLIKLFDKKRSQPKRSEISMKTLPRIGKESLPRIESRPPSRCGREPSPKVEREPIQKLEKEPLKKPSPRTESRPSSRGEKEPIQKLEKEPLKKPSPRIESRPPSRPEEKTISRPPSRCGRESIPKIDQDQFKMYLKKINPKLLETISKNKHSKK